MSLPCGSVALPFHGVAALLSHGSSESARPRPATPKYSRNASCCFGSGSFRGGATARATTLTSITAAASSALTTPSGSSAWQPRRRACGEGGDAGGDTSKWPSSLSAATAATSSASSSSKQASLKEALPPSVSQPRSSPHSPRPRSARGRAVAIAAAAGLWHVGEAPTPPPEVAAAFYVRTSSHEPCP